MATDSEDFTDFLDIPLEGIEVHSELDDYLSLPLERVRDPIAWWWEHRAMYPKLSAMAFDYLSIPGSSCHHHDLNLYVDDFAATSTAVERLFSQGRQLLHFTRSRLSPSMIRAFLCFGDWSRKDLVDMPDLALAIRGSRERKRPLSDGDSIEE